MLLILTLKCTQEPDVLNNTDLIFHDSYQIKIDSFSYLGEQDKRYFCQGDTFFYTTIADTFDNKPLIQWDDTVKFKIITVAIFTSPISVKNNAIKNSNDIIWQWNSGMDFENYASIKYAEGKYVYNNSIEYNHEPEPLKTGLYYWAVWAWNPEGTKILCSTRQMCFYVQ